MNPFFNNADLAGCFQSLTEYASVIKGAYRTAGHLLKETVCKGRHGLVVTLADIRAQTGISEPTIKDHLKTLHKTGIFFSHEYGQGGHKERLIVLGSPEGLAFLAEYSEALDTAPQKNLGANDSEQGLPQKNLGAKQPIGNLPEKNLRVKTLSHARTHGSDLIRTDLLKSDQIRRSEASESVQAEVPAEEIQLPRQLSFRANLVAAAETLIQLDQWLSAQERQPEAAPAGPARILAFEAATEAQTAPVPASVTDPQPPTAPQKPADSAANEAQSAAAAMNPLCQRLAEFGRSKLGVDIRFDQETDGERLRKSAIAAEQNRQPSQRHIEEQEQIAKLKAEGAYNLIRSLHSQCIAPGWGENQEKRSRYEELRVRELIEDVEAADPRLLLYLKQAFEQALHGGARSVSAARMNLAKLAGQAGIVFAARRDHKAA